MFTGVSYYLDSYILTELYDESNKSMKNLLIQKWPVLHKNNKESLNFTRVKVERRENACGLIERCLPVVVLTHISLIYCTEGIGSLHKYISQ